MLLQVVVTGINVVKCTQVMCMEPKLKGEEKKTFLFPYLTTKERDLLKKTHNTFIE